MNLKKLTTRSLALLLLAVLALSASPALAESAPGAVSSVAVTRGDGTATAKWDAPAGATKYHVTYSSDDGASWSLAALEHTSTSITISVDNAKSYIVGVRAGNEHGWSNTWVNSPPSGPYTPPAPPSVTAERNADKVSASVSWTTYRGDDFSYYQVIVCSDAQYDGSSCSGTVYKSGAIYDAASTGPVPVSGLDAQTGYGVILQTWRTGGALKSYATIPALPAPPPQKPKPPAAPAGLTASAGNASATLDWKDPADSSITGYEFQVNHNDTSTGKFSGWSAWQSIDDSATATSHTISGLTNGSEYRYKLRAVNASGPGAIAPSEAPWYVAATPTLPAPSGLTVTPSDGNLTVSWNAVTGATGYDVQSSASLTGDSWQTAHSNTSSTSVTVTDDAGNPIERVRVRARNTGGAGLWTEHSRGPSADWLNVVIQGGVSAQSVQAQNKLAAPATITVTRDNWIRDEKLHVSWAAVPGASGYNLSCSDSPGWNAPGESSWWHCGSTTSATSLTVDNHPLRDLASDRSYLVAVRAVTGNAADASDWKRSEDVRPVFGHLFDLTHSRSGGSITLSWKPNLWTTGYEIDCAVQGQSYTRCATLTGQDYTAATHSVTISSWTAGGNNYTIIGGEVYDIKITSTNQWGSSATGMYAPLIGPLPNVSNLSATSDGFGIDISTNNTAATGFTTGSNSGGYTLATVTVKILSVTGSPSGFNLEIRAASGGNPASSRLHALNGSAPTAAGEYAFTCSGGCSLDANTTYFLVMQAATGFNWDTTASTTETNTPSNFGWSIADAAKEKRGNNNWSNASGYTGIFRVSATPDPSLTATNVAATTAKLTIAHHSGDWYYKHTNTGATCGGPVSGKTVNLAGLTGGTAYTYSAYTDSACTTGNLLATAASFTTPTSFTASGVTATTATLTIGGHTGGWWYQGGKVGGTLGSCTSVPSGNTVSLASLDSNSQYEYKAYSKANCVAADLIATERFNTSTSNSGPAFSATSVTWNTARLTLSGHTGGWWYKGGNRSIGESSCTAGPSNFILDLANLSGNTEYTYKAYSDSACGTQVARIVFRTLAAPALTAGSLTASGATLTLANHTGDWWYDGTKRGGTATPCTKAADASVTVTGLDSGTAYTYGAYTDSACKTANRLDTASFTTLTPSLTVSNVAATTATLTIANHGGVAWYYKHTNTGATCDGPVAAGTSTKDLTGLTAGTSYTYSAYSDSTCTTGNLIATAAQFSTPASLTVSNVGTTTARITVAGHSGQWWYQADTGPHTTCQGPVAAGTAYKDLTGLTAGSFYVYTAYSATGCADTVKLASAEVATAVTVSNLAEATTGTYHPIDSYGRGQGFTTGNADATLLSATVQFADSFGSVNATVSLRAAQSNGKPAATDRATLSGTPVKGQQSTFTCAGGGSNDCSLDANTKYFIYVSGSTGYLNSTDSNTETLQPANNGWSIEDAMRRGSNFDLLGNGYAMKIEVEAIPHEELTASSVTATGATLTLNRHIGAWWYKSTTTGQTTCTSAGSATSVTLTLTAGTSYTFSAYSDSTCTSGNLLATAAQFTTP